MQTVHSTKKTRQGLMLSAAIIGLAGGSQLWADSLNGLGAPSGSSDNGRETAALTTPEYNSADGSGELPWDNNGAKNSRSQVGVFDASEGQQALAEQIVADALILNPSGYTLSVSPLYVAGGNVTVSAGMRALITNMISGTDGLALRPEVGSLLSPAQNIRQSAAAPVALDLGGIQPTLANRDLPSSPAAAGNTPSDGAESLTKADAINSPSDNGNAAESFNFTGPTLQLGGDSQTITSLGLVAMAPDTSAVSSVVSGNASARSLVITGDAVTMNADLSHPGDNGRLDNTTLALAGGALDLTGRNIGAANTVESGAGSLNFNVASLQADSGSTGLLKGTTGNLALTGTSANAYLGATATAGGNPLANSSNLVVGSTDPGTFSLFNGGVVAGGGPILGTPGSIPIQFARGTTGTESIAAASGSNSPASAALRSNNRRIEVGVNANASGNNDASGASSVNWSMVSMTSLELTSRSSQPSPQAFSSTISPVSFTPSQSANTLSLAGAGIIRGNGGSYNPNAATMLASLQTPLQAAVGTNTSGSPGQQYNYSNLSAFNAAAADVQMSYAATPEPGGLMLLGLGMTALIARRRRVH